MRVGLIGSSGKMGREVIKSSDRIGIDVIPYFRSKCDFDCPFDPEYEISSIFEKSDVIINFSPQIYYELSVQYSKSMLLCSTGHAALPDQPVSFAFMYAPNVLVEWNILKVAIEKISSYGNFTTCIDDIHHEHKKDAPSGTVKNLNLKVNPMIRSVRKPNIASWHIVSLFDSDQIIRIEHQALNRCIYADSCLKVAAWLAKKPAGKYEMSDFVDDIDEI